MEGEGATRWAELEAVMADTGVNVGTNAGRANVPKATEETPSLVLALKPNAEENKGCGAPLAETPGSEEETCEEALLWIDEMMAGMEFPDCPNHSLGERVSQLRRPRTRSRTRQRTFRRCRQWKGVFDRKAPR